MKINPKVAVEYVSPYSKLPLIEASDNLESADGSENYPIIGGQPTFIPDPQHEGEAVLSKPVQRVSGRRKLVISMLGSLGIGPERAVKLTTQVAGIVLRVDRFLRNPDYIFLSDSRPASYLSPMHWRQHSFMKSQLAGVTRDATIIDIGAGTKPYSRLIKARTERYCSQDMVAAEVNKVGVEQEKVDFVSPAEHLPIPSDSFDYAICTEVLEHVTSPTLVMQEISRILKPGGKAIVTVPMIVGEHQQPWHFQNLTRYGLGQLAIESGMTLESISPRGGYGSVLAALIRFMPGSLIQGHRRAIGIPLRLIAYALSFFTSILLPFLFMQLDIFDRRKNYTLGYHCVFSVPEVK